MEQAGETVNREIKYVILGSGEADQFLNKIKPSDLLLLWEQEDGYKKA
jgi:hypothetical protein